MQTLLHQSIEIAAERSPSQIAFRCGDAQLTYEQLEHKANQLAWALIERGVQPGDRVGIYMSKSIEMPVAIYGIFKAGAAYVPIDPSAPLDRILFILKDCRIRHLTTLPSRKRMVRSIISKDSGLDMVVGIGNTDMEQGRVHCEEWETVYEGCACRPEICVTEDSLAYVMYTSGSTGTPKGLMHTHKSGLSYARYSGELYDVQPEDRLGNHSYLHFDMSTFEFFTGPLFGATTVIIPEAAILFPRTLAELVERERLTFWYSVPLALIQILNSGNVGKRDFSFLRWVMFGGEAFPQKYLRLLMKCMPNAEFANVYGPAEVNQCTHYQVPKDSFDEHLPIPLGKVWDGADGIILDVNDHEVKACETGELLISSDTKMQGYWGHPEMTRARLFTTVSKSGGQITYFRTGDLVSQDHEGLLHFHGRKDRQVKLRGYRLELDEVENVINAMEAVAEAAAVTLRGVDEIVELAVVVLPLEGAKISEQQILKHAQNALPAYGIPKCIRIFSQLPRTGSGKINRRVLVDLLQDERVLKEDNKS